MKNIYKDFGIYEIKNIVNDKHYIGKTQMNFGDRWDSHKSLLRNNKHQNKYLQRAWSKYGEENFEFNVVELCNADSDVNALEIKYIKIYKNLNLSYNLSDSGDGGNFLGKHLSEETKAKIGAKNKINMLGKKASEETKRKMSISQKNRPWTPEERLRFAELSKIVNTGRIRSDEVKEKLRKINQDNPPGAKLTSDDVKNIRRLKSEGKTLKALAEIYNTSPSYISTICHYRRWSHIE